MAPPYPSDYNKDNRHPSQVPRAGCLERQWKCNPPGKHSALHLFLGGAAVHRCDNGTILGPALAAEGALVAWDDLPRIRATKSSKRSCASDLIQPIQRSDLIGFRQRRIIEYRVAKIFDGRSHREHRLPDVDNFRRPVSDDMHAE